MLDDIKYCNYPNGEEYVRMYLSAMFRRKKRAVKYVEKLVHKEGVDISDELEISFASEYNVNDVEYFGETGVVLYARYPAASEDMAIIMSEVQFYKVLSEYITKNIHFFPENEQGILINLINICQNDNRM